MSTVCNCMICTYCNCGVLTCDVVICLEGSPGQTAVKQVRVFLTSHLLPPYETDDLTCSGVTMGWLLRLVTGGPTGGRGPTTVLFYFKSEGKGPDLRK